jgi:peptidase M15-like protein
MAFSFSSRLSAGAQRLLWCATLVSAMTALCARAEAAAPPPQDPTCGPGPFITFYGPDETCKVWWQPDGTGMPATLSFSSSDPKVVKVKGHPVTLPPNYQGPFPPPKKYIGTFVSGEKQGSAEVQVVATHPDGSQQNYSTWTITASYTCGDDRDEIIKEYVDYKVNMTPACTDFTQSAHTQYYSFDDLNTGDYDWAILAPPLIVPQSAGYGLDAWAFFIGVQTLHHVNSGYRNPAHNKEVGGAKNSRHMYGDATDLQNVTRSKKEYNALAAAAHAANADYIEPLTGPCKKGCVHADWRKHPGHLAEEAPPVAANIDRSRMLEKVGSSDWRTRQSAFEALRASLGREGGRGSTAERDAILDLCTAEARVVGSNRPLSEDYTEYLAALIDTSGRIADARIAQTMLNEHLLGTGGMAISAAAAGGDQVIDLIARRYHAASRVNDKMALILVVAKMLALHSLTTRDGETEARALLAAASRDSLPMVRIAAVRGFAHFSDRAAADALRGLAETDPYRIEWRGETAYPVRMEARSALAGRD